MITMITDLKTRWESSSPSLPWTLLLQYSPGSLAKPILGELKIRTILTFSQISQNKFKLAGILVLHKMCKKRLTPSFYTCLMHFQATILCFAFRLNLLVLLFWFLCLNIQSRGTLYLITDLWATWPERLSKGRSQEAQQLEVGAWRAPRLLSSHITIVPNSPTLQSCLAAQTRVESCPGKHFHSISQLIPKPLMANF